VYTSKIKHLIGDDKAKKFEALYGRRSNFLTALIGKRSPYHVSMVVALSSTRDDVRVGQSRHFGTGQPLPVYPYQRTSRDRPFRPRSGHQLERLAFHRLLQTGFIVICQRSDCPDRIASKSRPVHQKHRFEPSANPGQNSRPFVRWPTYLGARISQILFCANCF
jgi:hypothetical protein